jgi:hypothetical protein
MVGGRRARADKTGIGKPHRASADGSQLAASSVMSARESANGTRGCFPARVTVTGVPCAAGHDQTLDAIARGVSLQLEAL